jgi:hypothetical protein
MWEEYQTKKELLRKCLSISKRKKSAGKPRNRCLDDIKNNLKKMCVRGWRKKN